MKTIYKRDLPPVSLDGWQVTVLQLIFPTGFTSPKHVHPGFVLGYVLNRELRFYIEGEPQTLLSAALPSMKRRAPSICLLAARAPPRQPGFWLWLSAKKERN
jgi:hypothetical protein